MAPTRRDPWLDNAKVGLITLVVVGHLWAILPASTVRDGLYDFVYLWHMPAFVFVAGHLSRGFTWAPRRLWSLVTTLALPYFLFEAAMALFRIHVGGEELQDLYADPHFPYWFLLALIVWRLLTPLFRPVAGGAAVAIAVAVSLGAGLIGSDVSRLLDIARILGFLPFFVLGLRATPARLDWMRSRPASVLGVGLFGIIGLLAVNLSSWADRGFLYYRSYDEFDGSTAGLALTRAGVIAVGVAGTIAWLSLTPRVGGWVTRMGSATMIVYLLHGFAVKGLEYAGFGEWDQPQPWFGPTVAALIGVAITLGLSVKPVRRRLEPLVDPIGVAERGVDDALELAVVVQEGERSAEDAGEYVAAGTPVGR